MDVLVLKVLLTPCLVLAVSLAQRRWGHVLGGRLTALPLTSGPFVLILVCTQGADAGRAAVRGILLGTPAVIVFCALYGLLARRLAWPVCLLSTVVATALTSGLLVWSSPPLWISLVITVAGLALAWRTARSATAAVSPGPAWELPARVAISAVLVLTLGWVSGLVGAETAGILATLPALLCVLAPCAHRADGPAGPIQLTGGVLAGAPATALFFLVLLGTLAKLPVAPAFGLAALCALGAGVLAQKLTFTQARRAPAVPA
ncbi:hypothetical protein [Amycolatopsis nigrescens]|uniref:hypothetical protein n=1 Tax=Amycolatopsis nigrescens TaxID=381445 RepID=UPI00037BDFBB|nr:hypothetical protein [Amycolatopsis nigrescens]